MKPVSLILALVLLTGCSASGMSSADPKENPSIVLSGAEGENGSAWMEGSSRVDPLAERPKATRPTRREVIYRCEKENCPGHVLKFPFAGELPRCGPLDTSFTIDLTLVGDCLLATYMGQSYAGSFNWYAANREATYFLERVAEYFAEDDFTIANLETVLTDRPLKEVDKDHDPAFWFKGPAKNAAILASSSVEAVSLSNNHTGDYGEEGMKDTIAAVEDAGLLYGNGEKTLYVEKNGFSIALICNGLWSEWQADTIVQRIQEAEEQSDYQIVFFHGGTEHVREPEPWMVRACHKLVDAGADLVVGSHPHVLRPMEEYKGRSILYSLGNFCYGGHSYPENRTVIYRVRLTVDAQEVQREECELIPCYVYTGEGNNWQPAPIEDEEKKQKVLEFMAGARTTPF